MNIDANVRKIVVALLRKWKVLIIFAIIGSLAAYFYTANFTTLSYTSTVEFLAYAVDSNDELNDNTTSSSSASDSARISNTSKMNYAMKMLNTYIEIMSTNEFDSYVVGQLNDRINGSYTSTTVRNALTIEGVEDTAMFKATVTTSSADLSYEIAHQLETSVPSMMKKTNNGLVLASVEDKPIKASAAGSLGYPKNCTIGAIIGLVLAAAYVILRNLLDVRIKTSDELLEKYDIPVIGSIPNFEVKNAPEPETRHKRSDDNGIYGETEESKGDEIDG